jgi:PD-(D/E)XK nuclease superfamily
MSASYSTTIVIEKPVAWSYSALKNFETCPKRFYHYNVAKDVTEPESPALAEGHALHRHFQARLTMGTSLPLGYGQYEGILARFLNAPGATYAEQKLAITAEFKPTAFFSRDAWFRTVIDAAKVRPLDAGGAQATVLDWKTGKPAIDTTQLQLMAAAIFVHEPNVQRVKAGLVFLAHGQTERAEFVREDQAEIWGEVLPRVRALTKARHTKEYPPTPSGLCRKYCAVSSCPYHGRGG